MKYLHLKKIIDELLVLRPNYKDEGNDVMQLLVKLIMNALYGEFLRKDIIESYQCKSEMWMRSEYDERVLEYQKINDGKYIVKFEDDGEIEDEVKKVNTLPLQVAVFILSNSKRIMNHFIHAINGFNTNHVYNTDCDSLYIENKHWDNLNKTGLVGKNLQHGNNDYKDGDIFYGLFLGLMFFEIIIFSTLYINLLLFNIFY